MTVVARSIKATPARAAIDAWRVIVDLLAFKESASRADLFGVEGVASSLIASRAMEHSPIVVYGSGPRVRIYCLYDEEAIVGEDANEQTLASNPTEGDWSMSLPCPTEDLKWVAEALAKRSKRITARDLIDAVTDSSTGEGETKSSAAIIDPEAFFRP
jgi:hypothetical protein